MKKSNKINQIITLGVILILTAMSVLAQKPKAKTTPKPKSKTTQTEKDMDFAAMLGLNDTSDDKAKAEEFFKKGQAFWKNLDIQEAIEAFTEAIKLYPNYVAALGERGTINFMINKPELALPDFNAVLKLEPKNTKILSLRGQTLTTIALKIKETEIIYKPAADNAQKALADFNQALEIEPNNSSFYSYRGYLLLEFDFQKEAIADFKKAIEIDPKNDYAYRYFGYAKFLSDDGMGITELGKAIELNPKNPESYFIRGKIHGGLGLLDEALKDFTKAIEINRYNPEYYNARGMIYFRRKDGDAAVKDFSKAIDEKRDFGIAYFNRAMTYKKFPYSVSTDDKMDPWAKIPMQRRKMMEDFSSAIKFNPNFAAAYIERGLLNSTSLEIPID
ncbi:MAG TPA: tetratricopeptide repeat protein, partial [Pyrinomonadaceae bacterium]|nr:tetratricopeptide repeat protein [Pyrinomonadaceae bacterium]